MDKLGTDWFKDTGNIDETREELDKIAKKKDDKALRAVVDFLCACLDASTRRHFEEFKSVLQDNLVKWKGHDQEVCEVLEKFQVVEEKAKADDTWYNSKLEDAVEELLEKSKLCHKKIWPNVVNLLVFALNKGTETHLNLTKGIVSADGIQDRLNKMTDEELKRVMDAFFALIKTETFDPTTHIGCDVTRWLCGNIAESAKSTENVKTMTEIIDFCSGKELFEEDNPTEITAYGIASRTLLSDFISRNTSNTEHLVLVTPGLVRIIANEEVSEEIEMSSIIRQFTQQGEVLAPHAEKLLDAFIGCEALEVADVLAAMYKHNPEPIKKRLPEIVEKMDDINSDAHYSFYNLFHEISKDEPRILMPYVEKVEEGLDDLSTMSPALQTMKELCKYDTKPFLDKIDTLEKAYKSQPLMCYFIYDVEALIGLYNEEYAERVMALLTDKLKTGDLMYQSSVLMFMKTVGGRYKSVLEKRRANIKALLKSSQPGVADMAQGMLDYLDDRSLTTLDQDIKEQKKEVDKLDQRVVQTEEKVEDLQDDVSDQRQQLGEVKEDVQQQGDKLTELEHVVDQTVEKVEEIDHKTLSAAPAWSRDVSLLMNEEGDYDWRFLAVRLGYGPEDIRAWATNADPTLAMLNEWYNTHRSSEATYAVLKSLQEMGRTDAAEIIETAMEEAGAAVPKPAADEPINPPPIFISYQWDIQDQVKLIKEHLQMAGYESWMDIGQMGGGDQLYAKIDKGMRGAKVVLAMVTPKYAESTNCNHEINLANLLNKPIIPLLVENTPWPPPGSMSMIFSQLLYIMFHGTSSSSGKFWPDNSFYELLGQLAYYAAPDQSLITDEYRDWTPSVEKKEEKESSSESKFVKRDMKSSPAVEEKETEPVVNPEVFLSYQWGHQPQVKALYSQLTSRGFTCWMDIQQMGGGDALYGKIDKGIRSAKVVVSCVTPKYTLSANCRREVSLADALRKPIVPLLLQDTSWPPEGPMSMAFTELLYIDCRDERTQNDWEGAKYEDLLQQVSVHSTPASYSGRSGPQTPDGSLDAREDNKTDNVPHTEPGVDEVTRKTTATVEPAPTNNLEHAENNSDKEMAKKKSKTCSIL
ncbi:Hypp2294 [Branchiostoma lanceolatum]|uniref:Hypp2294 protein n=1 Tax=Branchiostoma lanceolatum TaxID=7740 RepID=A0A8K0EPN0_BRALA|nr:Hypp2294 [Branchiostoma lanceolatum]